MYSLLECLCDNQALERSHCDQLSFYDLASLAPMLGRLGTLPKAVYDPFGRAAFRPIDLLPAVRFESSLADAEQQATRKLIHIKGSAGGIETFDRSIDLMIIALLFAVGRRSFD